jgi:hypothetical protein
VQYAAEPSAAFVFSELRAFLVIFLTAMLKHIHACGGDGTPAITPSSA